MQNFLFSGKQESICAPYIYMKTKIFNLTSARCPGLKCSGRLTTARLPGKLAIIALALQLTCCGDSYSSRYTLEFPRAPQTWVSLLGEPHWRVEWFSPDGGNQTADILPGGSLQIELPATWANPVSAWPYWPSHNLITGLFMPAGALFPFDVSGNSLRLSWEAGPDAVFYRELSGFAELANSVTQAGDESKKKPANFDWLRFRELLQSENINTAARQNPWLVDWRFVAEKTIEANFDSRRLVPQTADPVSIPVPSGPWYGSSPFASPLAFAENETPSFPVRPGLNVWICREGILRVNGKTWMFTRLQQGI